MVTILARVPSAEREAVDWFLRLQDPRVQDDAYPQFQAWLEGDPGNRTAYDKVDRLWIEMGQPGLAQMLAKRRAARPSWARVIGGSAAIAASVAAAVVVSTSYRGALETYSAPVAQSQQVALKDGSTLNLAPGSAVAVRIGWRKRTAVLSSGEVLFDIAHEEDRPFQVRVGQHNIDVLGTAFDVRRRQGGFQVAVLRGKVRVSGADDTAVALVKGDHYDHRAGLAPALVRAAPQDLDQWRAGRRIYRDTALADVAADLSLAMDQPVRISPNAAALRFSGVLRVTTDADMVRQLEALLPVDVRQSANGLELSARSS